VFRRHLRDDTILIPTKPFLNSETIVLKLSLDIRFGNEALERRNWALKKTGDYVQCSIVSDLYSRVNVGTRVIVLPMDRRADNAEGKRG
jgi:hypothetical protein